MCFNNVSRNETHLFGMVSSLAAGGVPEASKGWAAAAPSVSHSSAREATTRRGRCARNEWSRRVAGDKRLWRLLRLSRKLGPFVFSAEQCLFRWFAFRNTGQPCYKDTSSCTVCSGGSSLAGGLPVMP